MDEKQPQDATEADVQTNDELVQGRRLLLAAYDHALPTIETLLRTVSVNFQVPATGFTPLHTAVGAIAGEKSPCKQSSGHGATTSDHAPDEFQASTRQQQAAKVVAKVVETLLLNGAIWNDVDHDNETPGCVALRLGCHEIYEIMVNAGVRAEMLLMSLAEYEKLSDNESDPEDGHEEGQDDAAAASPTQAAEPEKPEFNGPRSEDYLDSILRFNNNRILDEKGNAVMMVWESDIMRRSAELLVPTTGLRVLNVGHGMGIIDSFFQDKEPSLHHIIEPHEDVHVSMSCNGWYGREGVVIHERRWQDVVEKLRSEGVMFDAIYFDTFAEDYKTMREFFDEWVFALLDEGGRFGFFNGMGADRQICYDVYGKIVEIHLDEAGLDVEWETMEVPEMGEEGWGGVKRKYWALKEYRLPTCTFKT